MFLSFILTSLSTSTLGKPRRAPKAFIWSINDSVVISSPSCSRVSDRFAGCYQRQRLSDERRLVRALDLKGVARLQQHPSAFLLDIDQCDAEPHPVAGLHRRKEAHSVQAVVERSAGVGRNSPDLHLQRRNKRESQVAMRDWCTIETLALCARHIDVDPLTVAAAFGELVDPRLVHRNPARHAQFLPNVLGDPGKSEFRHCESSGSAFARCRLSHSAKNFSMIAADSP